MADITKELPVGSVDDYELSQVILGFYGHGSQYSLDEVVYSPTGAGEESFGVKLKYKGRKITAIEAGPGFKSEDLEQLHMRIHSELLSTEQVIGRSILFSVYAVNSFYRAGTLFQILPVPPDAPRPSKHGIVGFNGNPLLLEFPFTNSRNQMIKAHRRQRKAFQIALFLNSILECPITMVSNRFIEGWVACHDDSSAHIDYRYCQQGYSYDGFDPYGVDFTPTESLEPMIQVDPTNYYGQPFHLGHHLQLPNNMDVLVEKFFSLPNEETDRFLRAAFWLYQSGEIISRSASFLSLIYAIDALVPPEEGRTICPSCKQLTGQTLTQRFVEFLNEVVPERAADPANKRAARRELCTVRGDLVHGRDLLSSDRNAWIVTFDPKGISEWNSFSYASTLAKVALVNWLVR